MIFPYALKLLCLCLASFFVVNAALGLTAALGSRAAIRIAESMRARSGARILFAMRVLPCALGIGTVLALCVPSYLWLEPQASAERSGWACLTFAILGALGWIGSIVRAARAVAASVRFNREWQQAGCETLLADESLKAVIVEKRAPLLALAGIFRPRLIVSQAVLCSLSKEELQLALQHENAHHISLDNLKRLLLLLVPSSILFVRGHSSLERCWAKFSEWAADDDAVRGDSHRALSLAEALLRVTRLGAAPRLSFLHTSLCAGDHDLSERVDRLLQVQPLEGKPTSRSRFLAVGSSLGIAVCGGALLAWPATLSAVHRLLEVFLQ
jgi:Zn-dependent protease with chaperone function